MTPSEIFDDRACLLGEGPLWHPVRQDLFWFDITSRKLHSKARSWHFDLCVSAAGWIDKDSLLIASQIGLHRFDLTTGHLSAPLVGIESDNPVTRSNDGRADPWGGFWIGTMGFNAEKSAGAIYRYYQGELRVIAEQMSITNAICFTPDRRFAHYTDTPTACIMRRPLDPETGWPMAEAQVWADLSDAGLSPDGAVVDANGTLWAACWGAGAVVGFDTAGNEIARYTVPGRHSTCPAFGGPELSDLYVTSATQGIQGALGDNGKTFVLRGVAHGQQEHRVIL